MKSRVIFASLILALGLVANQANATTTSIDDSPVVTKSTNTLLATDTQKQFVSYVEQHFGRFAKHNDWQEFAGVIAQYNGDATSVLTFDANAQRKFNQSATAVDKKLARENSAESAGWQQQASRVTRMLNFIWNVQAEMTQPTDNE